VDLRTGNADVWIMDLATGTRSRFTAGTGDKYTSIWSPDGKQIAYASSNDRGYDVVIRAADGGGEKIVSRNPVENVYPTSWSPDGRFLLIDKRDKQLGNVMTVALDGDPTPQPVAATPSSENLGQISPNGRYVAYMSDESGRFDVYVTTFPKPGSRWQVSQSGGREPRWSRDGKELFFFTSDNRLIAADVRIDGPSFEVGMLHPLFQSRQFGVGFRYDVSKDGKRFLVHSGLPEEMSPITLVTNWTAELEKKK
jgi:Tol biopolymer transport system component